MDNWVEIAGTWLGLGAGTGAGFVFTRFLLEWIAGRMDKRAEHLDATSERLMKALEQRVDTLTNRLDKVEKELAECQSKHAKSEAEVARLTAVLQAYGDARQHAALIVAAEKVDERKASL